MDVDEPNYVQIKPNDSNPRSWALLMMGRMKTPKGSSHGLCHPRVPLDGPASWWTAVTSSARGTRAAVVGRRDASASRRRRGLAEPLHKRPTPHPVAAAFPYSRLAHTHLRLLCSPLLPLLLRRARPGPPARAVLLPLPPLPSQVSTSVVASPYSNNHLIFAFCSCTELAVNCTGTARVWSWIWFYDKVCCLICLFSNNSKCFLPCVCVLSVMQSLSLFCISILLVFLLVE